MPQINMHFSSLVQLIYELSALAVVLGCLVGKWTISM